MKRMMVATLLLSGCAPTLVQTANTVGKNNFQVGIEPGFVYQNVEGIGGGIPVLNVAGRYGVSDRVDIGGRIGWVGYALQGKFMLTDPDTDGLRVSLVPEVSGITAGGGFVARTNFGALFGIPVGESELTIGALTSNTIGGGGGGGGAAGGFVSQIGGSVGYAAKLGDNFMLMPEVGFKPLIIGGASATGGGSSSGVAFAPNISFALGFLIGGSD